MKVIKHKDKWYLQSETGHKEILLSTDDSLIKDGVKAIDDEFLEWFVKNPSCEKVDFNSIPRCCGRCNGEDDLCYSDMTCDNHKERGCEICYGKRVEYLITIPKEELKTSEEWQKQFPDTKVIDPDGWDRKNYQYSWFEEKITLIEYTSRLHRSTVKGVIPKEEPKQETLEEVAEKYANKKGDIPTTKLEDAIFKQGFIDGAKSNVAKAYWYNIFKQNL